MRAARASLNDGFFEVRNEEGRKARTSPDSFIVSDQARIPTTDEDNGLTDANKGGNRALPFRAISLSLHLLYLGMRARHATVLSFRYVRGHPRKTEGGS